MNSSYVIDKKKVIFLREINMFMLEQSSTHHIFIFVIHA